jgi:hypothetical protein
VDVSNPRVRIEPGAHEHNEIALLVLSSLSLGTAAILALVCIKARVLLEAAPAPNQLNLALLIRHVQSEAEDYYRRLRGLQ